MTDEASAREVALQRAQADLDRRRAHELELQVEKRERAAAREVLEARRRARETEVNLRRAQSKARGRLSQSDVPIWALLDVLPVAKAVRDRGGLRTPVPPHLVADDLSEGLASTTFRTKTAASAAYGLTDGGAQADGISLTELGLRVLAGGEDAQAAAVGALLMPKVLGAILTSYNGSAWPSDSVLRRRLLRDGYAEHSVDRAVEVIRRNVVELGLIGEAPQKDADSPPQDLQLTRATEVRNPPAGAGEHGADRSPALTGSYAHSALTSPVRDVDLPAASLEGRERVFISTTANKPLLGELAEILSFGGYLPVAPPEGQADVTLPAAVERMRTCTAAVVALVPDPVRRQEPDEQSLIRIGAAVALCGDRAVFLCPTGLPMPPAYEHLRHIHYPGGSLDHESTMALLRAFNNLRGTR